MQNWTRFSNPEHCGVGGPTSSWLLPVKNGGNWRGGSNYPIARLRHNLQPAVSPAAWPANKVEKKLFSTWKGNQVWSSSRLITWWVVLCIYIQQLVAPHNGHNVWQKSEVEDEWPSRDGVGSAAGKGGKNKGHSFENLVMIYSAVSKQASRPLAVAG